MHLHCITMCETLSFKVLEKIVQIELEVCLSKSVTVDKFEDAPLNPCLQLMLRSGKLYYHFGTHLLESKFLMLHLLKVP